jgi:predicted transcriptional regulator
MKKDISMTVRLEAPLGETVQKLAKNDDRSIGYILRMLIIEALQARRLLPKK